MSLRSWPFGLLALSLLAAALLLMLLNNASFSPAGGGESMMAAAFEGLFLVAALWIVLVIMLFVGGLLGSMPRWTAWLAIVLVPMAAIADTVALDMCSRHMQWALALVAALPLLVGYYAWWARLRPASAPPAERTSAPVWGVVFLLSVVTFVVASY